MNSNNTLKQALPIITAGSIVFLTLAALLGLALTFAMVGATLNGHGDSVWTSFAIVVLSLCAVTAVGFVCTVATVVVVLVFKSLDYLLWIIYSAVNNFLKSVFK